MAGYSRQNNYTRIGNFIPTGLKYTPIGDKVRETVLARNEQYEKVAEQGRILQEAISKMPLAAEESEYRSQLLKNAQEQINRNPRDVSGAMKLAGDFVNNPVLLAKSKYYNQREEVRKTLESNRNISSKTREWWWSRHKYNFTEKKDANGNVIGGEEFNPTDMPLDDIKWEDAYADILRIANPNSSKRGWSRSHYDNGTGGGSSGSSGSTSLPQGDIYNAMHLWVQDNFEQVKQAYDVGRWEYDENVKRLEELRQIDPNSQEYKDLSSLVAMQREVYENTSKSYTGEQFDRFVQMHINTGSPYNVLGAFIRTESESNRESKITDDPSNSVTETTEHINENGDRVITERKIPGQGKNSQVGKNKRR